MKYRYLSIILLILIFSLGAVSAQDNTTDVISAGSDVPLGPTSPKST